MGRVLSMVTVAALWGLLSGVSLASTVRIATDEYPPFQGQQLPQHGLIGQMITEAFASQGLKVEYSYFPWKRGYQYVKESKWDATPYWGWDSNRAEQFLFSEQPILTVQVVFFHLASTDFDWKTLEDLEPLEIGGIDGYTYTDAFIAAAQAGSLNVSWSASHELNFKKLLRKRVTIFPQGLTAGKQQIAALLEQGEITQAQADSITWHPLPLVERKLYLLFSRDKQPLVDAFDRGVRQLKTQSEGQSYWHWLTP